MAGIRKSESNLPSRTYFKHGAYYYVHKDTGKWARLSSDKFEAIRMAKELNKYNPMPTKLTYDLSASHEISALSRAAQLRTAIKMYRSAKDGARHRGLAFELTQQDVINVLLNAKGHCVATGIEFSDKKEPGARIASWKPSLDRIDSSQGYTFDNVRVVCAIFNIAIQDHGDSMFKKLAQEFLKTCLRSEVDRPVCQ